MNNYCGPWWSDGKIQSSVVGTKPALSELDASCKAHDAAYALGQSRKRADMEFARETIGKGVVSSLVGLAVGAQGLMRSNDISANNNKTFHLRRNSTNDNFPQDKNKKMAFRGSRKQAASKRNEANNDKVTVAPAAIATQRTGKAPQTRNMSNGSIEVTHREFLRPIEAFADYTADYLPANPGVTGTFPWLAKLARRYEEYRFKRLRFEYRSVAATSRAGVVMISYDYDAADELPQTKAIQAQTVPNTECNVWMNNNLSVPTDSKWRFVRPGALSANLDIKTYDAGQLVYSSMYGDNAVSGELYVDYVVELRHPTAGATSGGTRYQKSSVDMSIPFHSFQDVEGKAFPLTRLDDTSARAEETGGFIWIIRVDGTGLTAGPAMPTVTGDGEVVSLGASTQSSRAILVLKINVFLGDVLTLTSLGTGTGAKVYHYIGAGPFEDLIT